MQEGNIIAPFLDHIVKTTNELKNSSDVKIVNRNNSISISGFLPNGKKLKLEFSVSSEIVPQKLHKTLKPSRTKDERIEQTISLLKENPNITSVKLCSITCISQKQAWEDIREAKRKIKKENLNN